MKNLIFKPLCFLLLLLGLGACNSEEALPPMNPFLGEWKASGEQFLTLTVNGEEKSLEDFGVQVLRSNTATAVGAAEEYLRYTIMGPIDIYEPLLLLTPQELFAAQVEGERVTGIWKLQNSGSVLHLNSLDLRDNGYYFNIKRISVNELELDWSWEMSYIGENSGVFKINLKIHLKK
ncbi:hypothetical protein [Cecembia calidifontis]|jgi:hypothetical protein|uniref:Lipocalin-like protein n=1 Tax=Cecembia calidifontis TaxID=1187080 RepID=A0A4Q7PDF5_9BACT|nr:hypothetical protein [Cecembia calidifontis]RZS97788.1 hypothetical protein BC751_3415 [Cecembia calidifontis]